MISWPVEVAASSGSAASRPVMIMRATEREAELLKLRAARVPAAAVRARPRVGRKEGKVGIVGVCGVGRVMTMGVDGGWGWTFRG